MPPPPKSRCGYHHAHAGRADIVGRARRGTHRWVRRGRRGCRGLGDAGRRAGANSHPDRRPGLSTRHLIVAAVDSGRGAVDTTHQCDVRRRGVRSAEQRRRYRSWGRRTPRQQSSRGRLTWCALRSRPHARRPGSRSADTDESQRFPWAPADGAHRSACVIPVDPVARQDGEAPPVKTDQPGCQVRAHPDAVAGHRIDAKRALPARWVRVHHVAPHRRPSRAVH